VAPEPKKRSKQAAKNDPKLIAAARELRGRWLERVNSGQSELPAPMARYAIGRSSSRKDADGLLPGPGVIAA
jgi:hypothetical protein